MATSKKSLRDTLRARYMDIVRNTLVSNEDDVLVVGSNEFAIPCVDAEGNDEFVVITVKVPTGSRDGDAYDGYVMEEEYRLKCAAKAKRELERAAAKAKKIAADEERRKAKKKDA